MQASLRRLAGHGTRRLGARGVTHTAADTRLDNVVEEYAHTRPRRLSVKELLDFASNPDRIPLIEGARYLQKELPVRLAHRIQDMHKLPFIVGCNPHINQVYNLYLEAFHEFRSFPEIKTLEQQNKFVDVIASMIKKHGGVISTLGQSVHEIQQYMPASDLKQFLDKMIRTRISRRVIVEQHISVYRAFSTNKPQPPGFLGIFDTECNPARLCTKIHRMVANMCTRFYGAAPELVLDGDVGASFTYIPIHIEIILLELLKNSMRAVVDFHKGNAMPPLQVTICRGDNEITIRIRDQGGGIDPEHFDAVWDYTYTSHRQNSAVPHLSAIEQEIDTLEYTLQAIETDPTFIHKGVAAIVAGQRILLRDILGPVRASIGTSLQDVAIATARLTIQNICSAVEFAHWQSEDFYGAYNRGIEELRQFGSGERIIEEQEEAVEEAEAVIDLLGIYVVND